MIRFEVTDCNQGCPCGIEGMRVSDLCRLTISPHLAPPSPPPRSSIFRPFGTAQPQQLADRREPKYAQPSETRTNSRPWGRTIMDINRRTLLASGTTLAGLSVLGGETMAKGAAHADLPKDAVVLTATVKAKPGQEEAVKEALLSLERFTSVWHTI
jgi:hypothetical protein